jgi:hypothetical protein
MRPRAVVLVIVSIVGGGCASFRSAGRNVVGGALDELERRGGSAAITRNAVVGARDELTSDDSREKLKALQTAMMAQMTIDAAKLRQELLGEAFRADIDRARAEFLDKSRVDLNRMRDELLGARTKEAAGLVADRIVGDITRQHLGLLRDEILGVKSRLLAQQLVRGTSVSMQVEMDTLRARLEGDKQELRDELQRTLWVSGTFIVVLVVAVTALMVVVRRRERIIEALSEPIQAIHDGHAYEDLTRRIFRRARDLGVSALVMTRLVRRDDDDAEDGGTSG